MTDVPTFSGQLPRLSRTLNRRLDVRNGPGADRPLAGNQDKKQTLGFR